MNTIVEHVNSAGHAFVEFALPMLIQSSVLIVILLFLDLLLRKKVKAVFRYWIWMLVLIKLILPTSLSSPLSLGYLFGEKLTYQDLAQSSPRLEPTVPAPAELSSGVGSIYIQPNPYIPPAEPLVSVTEPVIAETISPPQVPVTPLTWQGVVFLVWLAVVIAMGLLLLQRALFVRGLVAQAKKAGHLMNDALSYCCVSMGIKSKVRLKISVNATTPSVCGLIRPVILVPWKLTSTLGASRLRTILMHELAHIRRGDLWVNLAQTALQIIYFYNPLLWLANFVIRRIREQAVDEAVLVAMGEKAQKYPQTLVDVAKMAFKRPALGLRLIGVVESRSALAGRIKHILSRPIPKSARLGLISILAIIVAGAVLLPMAKAKNEGGFSDKDLLIMFTELPEGEAKKVSVGDKTTWSKDYEVEFAPGEDLLVVVEMYQAGQPMRIIGRNIFEGSQKPGKFTVTFDRAYQDAAKSSVTHNIKFQLGDQAFTIPVHTPRYLSTQWWDWYRGEGLRRPEMRYTKTRYTGIETLFYYGAANLSMESEYKAKFWIPGRDVTPVMNQYGIALKMIPLSSLKYLYVKPIGGYQGLDGKIISMNLTLEEADRIAGEYKQMIINSVEKQWAGEKQTKSEASVGDASLDHFVGRYAVAGHPDTPAFEITKKGDVFTFRDLGGPKFEMDIVLRVLAGRSFEMEKGRNNLKFGEKRRDRFCVRYEADEDRYILDGLGMRGEVQDGISHSLTDLVKISPKKPDGTFAVTLPNGVTVELVGLSEHPSEGKKWWRPDGTFWEDRPYEEFSSHNTSGEKGYELVWRLRSDEDVVCEVESPDQAGSAGKDVLHNERGLRPAFRNGESYGVTLFFSSRLSQASIGIGVGLDRNWKTIASLEGDISKASSSINNVHLYPAIETDGRTCIDAAYRFTEGKRQAYRLVAVDTDNRQHVMQRGSETKGRGDIHCRKKIDLPLKRIKTIHFQIQPLQWITFDNVSLRPGNKTNMEVKVEEPEPVLTDEIVTTKVRPDAWLGIESSVSPKLVMLLDSINSCAAETDLNIDSISITESNISIKGDTSDRANTRKFLDAIEKNGLNVSQLRLYAADNRNKFSIIVEPEKDWQRWWQQRKTDVQLGLEENISPKLLMLLGAIADCAAETELNIKSISIKENKIKIEGDTSSRTNTLKFFDAVKKNELKVLQLNFITRDNRDKFSITAEPKENWRQWWQKHKTDIKADVPAEEEVVSKLSQLERILAKPPIVAYDVKLNFADPTVRDGTFHSEQSVAFSLSFHNIEIPPAEKFTLGHLLIGQTTWPIHLEENGIAIHEGVTGQKIKSLKWPAGEPRFDKVIKIPVKYGNREYSCPVRVDLDRYNKDAPTGAYWFCAYLSGRLPWGAGGRGFEIVNLDQQMEFRLTGDGTDPRDAVLGIDINGDGKIDSAKEGGEQFDLYEPFVIGSKVYQLAEVDPYLPRVVFREVDAIMLPHPLAKTDVPVEVEGTGEENQVIWGKPSQGVQVGISVEKEKWPIGGDVPRLNVEVRVSDPKKFRESGLAEKAMAHDWSAFAVEVDGKRYKQNVFTTVEPVQLRSPFNMVLSLDDEWQGGLYGEEWLNPGRHKIRVLFVGLGMRLPSEPVEIEILPDDKKPEPWPYPWGEVVRGVQVSAHPAQPSWPVGSEPVIRICLRNQGKEKWSIHERPSSFALEVDGKRYENNFIFHVWRRPFEPGDVYQFDLKLSKSKSFHDGLRKGNIWPPVGKPPPLLVGKHTVRVLFTELGIEPEPASRPVEFEIIPATSDVHVEAEPGGATSGLVWGKQVNGLRAAVEFVPEKNVYSFGQTIGLRYHIQNVSAEPIQFISDTWRQNDGTTIEDEEGKRQPVSTAWYSDWTAVDRYYLKPGEKTVVESAAFGIAANNEQADDLGYPVGYTLVCEPGIYSVGFSVRIPNASASSLPPQADDWEGVLQTGKHKLVVTAASGPDRMGTVPVGNEKAVVGGWEDIGNPISADFNDTIALTEQITLGSIGQDVEGKTFITFVWDREKDRNRQYRFVLIKNDDTVLEPDSHLIFEENGRLEEKFTFDEPYVSWRLKEFKFQNRSLPLAVNRTISSKLQKGTSTAFEGKTISPSKLAPPGRYAIELDGIDDYLFVPDSPTLRLEPPFTVEMWIKPKLPEQMPDRVQDWGVIAQGGYIGTGRVKPRGFGIQITRFEKEPATFNVSYQEANDKGLFGKDFGSYRFDEWMHISHVFDGGNYKPSHGHPLVIGRFLIPMPEPFMGQIGEVRIWKGARTREEISRYKNRALTGKEPGLAACWTFEQAEGQFAYDISGNNNHARLGRAVEADGADPKWVDLEAPVHQPGRIVNVPVEVEGTAKDEIGRLREVGERRTIPERRKGRIEFLGLDLTDAPRTTKSADLPDLFEERPPGSKSYEIASGVTVMYGGFEGTVYYIPERDVFYVQQDKLGSSTLTYYGPFEGDPKQVLDRQIDVPIETEEARASSGEGVPASNEDGPRITFESLVCDLGRIPQYTKHVFEFKFTNTGNEVLKITSVRTPCACTVPKLTEKEYAPGESGTLKITYHSGASAGQIKKYVYVHSNDKVNPRVKLTIKAEIVIKVKHEPKRLNLVFDKENAGCPAVTLTSLDNQPFSITGFESTGGSITADFDSSVKRTSFVIRPKVDMEKLRKGMRGQINVSLDHPECKKITVSFETLADFKIDPRIVYVREAEPQKPVTKKVRILSNYNEDFEIESTSSKNGTIKVLAQEKIRDGYQFELQITPPEQESKRRVFTDVFTVELKGGQLLNITCYGIYSRKSAETAGESVLKSDVHLEVAQSGGDSVYGSGDIVVVSEGKSKVYGSIQEAIDAAPAGSIVRIGPGVYKERLEIDKPLTLEGAAWDKTTIITENKSADVFEEAMNTFRKRILEAKSEEHAKKLSAELQAQFEAEMKENMAAQTHLVSDAENVVIRNLKLTSPGRSIEGRALSVPIIRFSNAGALMSGCAVVGTPGNGINIEEGSDVQIRDSLVAGVWSTGIAVASGRDDVANAGIINCDVRNCYHRGITIGPGCDSTVVRSCRISGSSWHGIRYDNASPTIIDNLIFANARCGIYASGRTAASVSKNLFYGNEITGISCWFKNQDTIEENTFVANKQSGLEVLGASRPIVRKNIFYANPTAVFCGNIGNDSPSATSDGTVNLEENLFWGFEYKVAWRHPGEAKEEVVTEEVKLDEKARNVVFDPEFEDITAEDFSLKLDSPARRPGIGAAVLIDYKSPWPLQDEEIPIIPEDKTEDTSWMGQISSTGKITRPAVVPVANKGGKKPQESIKDKPGKQEGSDHPGRISGVVVNSDTGEPIVGAYVGVGDFGDSGGSNYSRHRSEGFHDKTKTDAEGRFELDGLVFTDKHRELEYHPLVVTHPDFVRHDEKIELPSSGPVPDVTVKLRPAAKIDVTIVDADGNPLPGQWLIRLEALDGRRFIPPGSDPHLSSFASNVWAHWPDMRAQMGVSSGFTFTELDSGRYLIEAIRIRLVDKPTPGNIWRPTITYHGSIPGLEIEAGQTKQVRLTPQDHQTKLTITAPEFPDKLFDKLERSSQMPLMCLISRSPGALLWDDGKIRHLEDQRFGRIDKKRFFRGFFSQGQPLIINNLPPDSYSLFTMAIYGQVAGYLIGARADLGKGDKITVDIPWRQPTGPSMFGPNRSFDYPVNLEAKDYSVSQICEILTEITQSNPRIIADPSIENEKLSFGRGRMSVWDLLEKLYLDNGWRVDEGQDKTLIIKPAEQTSLPVEIKEREVGSVSVIRAVDNKAILTNGVTVELLGLNEIPIKDNPWWKPDSSLLEQPPFDNVGFDPSRDPDHDQFAYYAVAMRLKGKAPGEIGLIKWDLLDALYAGTMSAYLEDKRVYSRGIFGSASKFPKDVETTTLRLGLAAGDWQTLVKGSHYGVYREGEDSIIVRTPERAGGPLGVRPGEKGLHIGVTYNVTDRDFRVVAVDKDGKVHVSARSGSSGTDNLRQTTASFPDLTHEKLREFQFQTRPYEWIEFRDISLRPGKEVVALAEKRREETKEKLEQWLGRGQTRQIREQILVLRHCHIFKEMETWASAIRELVSIGRPAVPELLAEMRRNQRWPTQSTAAFALRAIGDPDSVQALIEILGQVTYRGEYGIHLKDPQLSVFMLENQHRPARDSSRKLKDPQITIGCPVIEITAALEKITGHTEGHEHYGHKAAAELGRDATRDKWQQRVQEIVRDVASRWQKWWEQNRDVFMLPGTSEEKADVTVEGEETVASSVI